MIKALFLGWAAMVFALPTVAVGAPDAPEICPVHKIKMERRMLRLVYGMPTQAEFAEMRVAKMRFPYGKDYVLAGCVIKPERTVEGWICPKCVEARAAWLKSRKR